VARTDDEDVEDVLRKLWASTVGCLIAIVVVGVGVPEVAVALYCGIASSLFDTVPGGRAHPQGFK
jgi:hypothetical protein